MLIPLREGRFIGGACALFDARALPSLCAAVARVVAARKSYRRMVGMLGVGFAARFLLRRVTLGEIEQRVQSLTGCSFRAVRDCAPVFAVDIDTARDLQRLLRSSQHPTLPELSQLRVSETRRGC